MSRVATRATTGVLFQVGGVGRTVCAKKKTRLSAGGSLQKGLPVHLAL
jgi:hypothetical protein